MSLDQNLFTLTFIQNKDDPAVLDLVDSSGTAHYRRQRVPGAVYLINVYDPLSESLLITATAPSATSKHKTLELFNPSSIVELKYTGTLTFRWNFKWEEHEFEWKREECFMLRKPDPPVLVAVTKEPSGRIKTSTVQILDYNLNRFDIDDRKGLEIVILTALLTFRDASDAHHTQDNPPEYTALPAAATGTSASTLTPAPPPKTTSTPSPSRRPSDTITNDKPPVPPPKPAPKTGVDRIAEMHAIRGDINDITVEEEGRVADYAQYCANLLQDEAMLFVTVHSSSAEYVPKVLQVVEETKRIRHKAGLSEEEELHQYVIYDTSDEEKKGPRRIKLDDDPEKDKSRAKYKPPTSLTVHMSKIPMPELQPKIVLSEQEKSRKSTQSDTQKGKEQDKTTRDVEELTRKREGKTSKKKDDKANKKDDKARKKDDKKSDAKLNKSSSHSPPHRHSPTHVQSYQVHPYQPSPSPSQLNNPGIYVAPPPRPAPTPYSHPPPMPPRLQTVSAQSIYVGPGHGTLAPPPPPPSFLRPPSPAQRPTTPSTVISGIIDKLSWR